MSSPNSKDDLRRWVEDRRATEVREREGARGGRFVPDSIGAALDLIDLARQLHGWPIPEDPVRRRENDLARDRWDKLRRTQGGR